MEAYKPLAIIKDFPNRKPFLLIWRKDYPITDAEAALRDRSVLIDSNAICYFYTLDFQTLIHMTDSLYNKAERHISKNTYYSVAGVQSSAQEHNFVIEHYDDKTASKMYSGNGAYEFPSQYYLTFFDNNIPGGTSREVVVSFWVGNINQDVIPRGDFEIMLTDDQDRLYEQYVNDIGKSLKIIDGEWGFIEKKIKLNHPNDRIKLTVWNDEISGKMNIIDELLIRPEGTDIFYYRHDTLVYNNRFYIRHN